MKERNVGMRRRWRWHGDPPELTLIALGWIAFWFIVWMIVGAACFGNGPVDTWWPVWGLSMIFAVPGIAGTVFGIRWLLRGHFPLRRDWERVEDLRGHYRK